MSRRVRWPLALAIALCACRSEPSSKSPKFDELREFLLSSPAPEEVGGSIFSDASHTQRELLSQFEQVIKEPKIKGVFLRVGGFGGSWSRAAELRSVLQRVRAAKKPVHCYFDNTDNSGYGLLASSCDRITMAPAGMLALTGVQAQVVYARELLELIGVRAELMQVGRFKGAADALTRSDMPAEVREVLSSLLDDLQAGLAKSVMTGRSLDAAAFSNAIDTGPHRPQAALEMHLVDAVGFDDEARAKAKAASGATRVRVALDAGKHDHFEMGQLFKALFSDGADKPKGKRIALAYLSGEIHDDDSESGHGSSSGPFIAALRRMADDKDIRAVVLRIDSPGGSALASDKMWHAVARVAKRKPLIVSIGDMAASGGYYVACAGSEIFAQDESLVGSIGVVGGKIVVGGLADRIGIRATALTRGKNAGWMSPFKPFSPSERDALSSAMTDTYTTFLSRVTLGRKLEPAKLSAVAEGRIMSGKRAREGGLVDTLGGLPEALARARSKASLPSDAKVEIWPNDRSLFDRATELFSSETRSPLRDTLLSLPGLADAPLVSALLRGVSGPLTVLPYALELN